MRRNTAVLTAVVLFLLALFGGCGKKDEADCFLYYITTERTGMVAVPYQTQGRTTEELLQEFLDRLSEDVNNVDYMKTIPAKVKVDEYQLDQGALSLYFNRDYGNLSGYDEVLIRSAIVRTLLQIDGIDNITFYVSNAPLQDATGAAVGSMDRDSFLFDFGEETDSLLSTTLTLYFAGADGVSLVKEERDVYYSSNISLEKLVMDQLLKGPDTENAISALPANTKLLNISVTDGVCYVNLDGTFMNQVSSVSDMVTIYSIVNSLTELDNITKVQILVSGNSNVRYHDMYDLSVILEPTTISLVEDTEAATEKSKEIYIE